MKTARHITAEFIPHDEFHTGIWLQSVSRPGWYYFMKKKSRNVITNPDFRESVDPPLRELVEFLHAKGVRTTPSCAGHHFSGKDFKKIYSELEADAETIRTAGMELKDVESGEIYFYRDAHYRLPWDREEFLREVLNYQAHGIIGLRVDRFPKKKKAVKALQIPGVQIREKLAVVLIYIAGSPEESNDPKWEKVTAEIRKIFR